MRGTASDRPDRPGPAPPSPRRTIGLGKISDRSQKLGALLSDAIRERIATGDLAPGDTLPTERDMQEEFGVSRATLREALRTLEAEGLITSTAGGRKGARVEPPSIAYAARFAGLLLRVRGATIGNVFAVRMLLEPAAARLVAERSPVPDLSELHDLLAKMRENSGNPRELGRLRSLFDEMLLSLSGNEALAIIGQILSHISLNNLQKIPETVKPFPQESVETINISRERLTRVVEAIERGQAGEAENLLLENMKLLEEYYNADVLNQKDK